MPNYDDQPKLDFSIFKNQFGKDCVLGAYWP